MHGRTTLSSQSVLQWAAACLGLAVAGSALAAPPAYRIDMLERSNGIKPIWVTGISDNGNIVGCGRDSHTGTKVMFVKKSGKKAQALQGSSGHCSNEGGVNDAGEVLSEYSRDEGDGLTTQGALWTRDGELNDLEQLAGCDNPLMEGYTDVGDINQAGDVAFILRCNINGAPVRKSALWRKGKVTMLHGGESTRVYSLNNLGQAAGVSGPHAATWEADGSLRLLSALADSQTSYARAINDLGHVVGHSTLSNFEMHGFLFDGDTTTELPMCEGKYYPGPTAITNDDLVVGGYGTRKNHHVALIQDGQCYALDSLLDATGANWTQLSARGTNNAGVIVGQGFYLGKEHSFIATPLAR